SHLFAPGNAIVSVTCEREEFESIRGAIAGCFDGSAKTDVSWNEEHDVRPLGVLNEGFTTSGQVQYVALAGSYAGSGVEYSGAMAVFRQLMNYEYLWQNVRVRGGAYGCGAAVKRNGRGVFVSYRDPNLSKTVEVYEGAADYLRNFDADDDTMTKYVIGTFSGIDTPLTPATFGTVSMMEYLSGITQEMRQKYRTEVLETSAEDIRSLAGAVEAILKDRSLCVVGSESAIRKDSGLFKKTEPLL
ncbi:MAG: insulinase family protein, partial [Lachnospiraceae bacterium]|nr:insulinase family protein [Lachnospiraceae bacterium]